MPKFTISRNRLLAALLRCKHALNAKNYIDVYGHFMFKITDEMRLELTTTDGCILMQESLPLDAYDIQSNVTFSMDRSYLLKAIKALDDEPLEFEVMDYQIKVHHSQGEFWLLRSDVDSKLPTIGDRYTQQVLCKNMEPEMHSVKLEIPGIKHWLNMCYQSIADDSLRPSMSCACLDFDGSGTMKIAASDGHQLTVIKRHQQDIDFTGILLLPRKVCNILRTVLPNTGMVALEFQSHHFHTEGEKLKEYYRKSMGHFSVQLGGDSDPEHVLHIYFADEAMNGRYPNYMNVMPSLFNYRMVVDRKILLKTVNRMLTFTNVRSRTFKLNIKPDSMQLSCDDKDFETGAVETIPCEFSATESNSDMYKPELLIGINGSMLASVLQRLTTEKIVWKFRDATGANIIYPEPQSAVEELSILMMPLML